MVVSLVNELPDCLLLRIFTFCNSKIVLWRARIVCRRWYHLLADNHFWKVCDLSNFKFMDAQLVKSVVQYLPMHCMKYLHISNNVIMKESMLIILETANHLHGLQLNNCEVRPSSSQLSFLNLTLASHRLRYLDLRTTKGDLRIFGDLLQTTGSNLKTLGISNTFSSNLLIKARSFLWYVKNLTILECNDCTWINDATMHDIADCCPSLQALDVSKCLNVQGTAIEKLMRKCEQLRNLVLRTTSIRDEEVLRAKWTDCQLTGLDISHCYYLQDSACRYVVRTLAPQLQYLCCAFTDELLEDLSLVTNLPIKRLELRRRDLLDMKTVVNFLSNCSLLQGLDLTFSPVYSGIFEVILPNLPALEWISFAGHEVLKTTDSLNLFTKYCKKLKYIGINYYHATCEHSLDQMVHSFLTNNKTIITFNLEGVYTNDVFKRLETMVATDSTFRQRHIKISNSTEFHLPSNELSVDSAGWNFQTFAF